MEKIKTFRIIIYIIAAIMASQFLLLAVMVRPFATTIMWLAIGLLVMLVLYLMVICLSLLKRMGPHNFGDDQ